MADVTPLPKTKPVKELKKDLRPISLTACLSKVAEECVVVDYVQPAALRVLDPNQYGAVPNSSTTKALIQKRAFSIISSGQDYHEVLEATGIPPIMAYIDDSCSNLFSNIIENDNHRLRELLPSANHPKHNLRRKRRFEIPRWRTNRFKNTFMMSSTIKYNNNS